MPVGRYGPMGGPGDILAFPSASCVTCYNVRYTLPYNTNSVQAGNPRRRQYSVIADGIICAQLIPETQRPKVRLRSLLPR